MHTTNTGRGRRRWIGVAAVLAVVGLTSCGGSEDSATSSIAPEGPTVDRGVADAIESELKVGGAESDSASEDAFSATTAAAAGAAQPTAGGEGSGQNPVPPALQPIDLGRSIIFTASVSVEVDNIATSSDAALQAIAGLGGFLYGQQAASEPTATNVLTFKVAPKDFQEALHRLGGLGKVVDQQVSTDDVTERVVDLESRIKAAEVSVERLRAFLAQATDVNALAAFERELLQRETDLETLRGQLRTIQKQVDLATITLTLTQLAPDGPAVALTVTAYAGGDEGATTCPGEDTLELTEGDSLTLCYEILNTGSLTLTELRLDDPGMDIKSTSMRVIDGDLDAPLAPDQSIMVAAIADVTLNDRPSPRLRGVAVDEDGKPVRTQIVTEAATPELNVEADTSLPGFVTALKKGWEGLTFVFGVLVVLVGVLLPFIWIVPVLYLANRWRKRRRAARPPRPAGPGPAGWTGVVGPVPPPPGPVPMHPQAPSPAPLVGAAAPGGVDPQPASSGEDPGV